MRRADYIILFIIFISFVLSTFLYPQMPQRMASHWNIKGEVDGYISKFWGLFLMPFTLLVLFLLFLLIPKVDPLKENIKKFRRYFDGFILLITLFLFYVYLLTILWNLGVRFDMGKMTIPTLGLLFYYTGILIEHTQRNWFIGIRTPWTLSSEEVWKKTHKLGGRLLKISGIVTLLGIFFQDLALLFAIVLPLFSVLFTVFYSYFEYSKTKDN